MGSLHFLCSSLAARMTFLRHWLSHAFGSRSNTLWPGCPAQQPWPHSSPGGPAASRYNSLIPSHLPNFSFIPPLPPAAYSQLLDSYLPQHEDTSLPLLFSPSPHSIWHFTNSLRPFTAHCSHKLEPWKPSWTGPISPLTARQAWPQGPVQSAALPPACPWEVPFFSSVK